MGWKKYLIIGNLPTKLFIDKMMDETHYAVVEPDDS